MPAIPIMTSDNLNHDEQAKIAKIKPYSVTAPNMSFPLGSLSPVVAIRTELHRAPNPMAVRSSP